MNTSIKKLDLTRTLFFDAEFVRRNETLQKDSDEYFLYRDKTKNKDTETCLSDEELFVHYKKNAALKPAYNRLVCISIGTISPSEGGDVILKSFTGDEEHIVKEFYKVMNPFVIQTQDGGSTGFKFDYLCGFNILGFDLPMIRYAAIKNNPDMLFASKGLPVDFNDSGKKPWELKTIIDLMDHFKGTYFYNVSLKEACYMLGVPSPKTDIDGSMVSEIYYTEENGLSLIEEYCKRDVLATINIVKVLRGEPIVEQYVDRG
jgi:predicted PolB exonuclease-like 3'-5' exonuclease